MLSIATVKGAGSKAMAKYYTSEFTEGVGEMAQTPEAARERSRWWGPGAAARGLADEVSQPALQAVLEGKDPRSGQVLFDPTAQQLMGVQKRLGIEREFGEVEILALREGKNPETGEELPLVVGRYVQNLFSGRRGVERQVSAVDLTLSAPKSVSLMVAAGEEGVRRAAEAAHEKAVFENVTRARAETLTAGSPAEAGVAEGHMQQALKSLFAVAEAYPQLQASQNFLQLQQSIVDTEDKIQASRRFYNGGVRELNTKIKVFPNNLFARNLGFHEREFFEVAGGAAIAEPPRIQF